MALFSKKDASKKADKPASAAAPATLTTDLSAVIIRPRITEKAASRNDAGVYVFDVREDANAYTVAAAVTALFKVTPRKVNIVPVPHKIVAVRGRRGVKGGGKKAYVFLKKGETIEVA